MAEKKTEKKITFEDALARLEQIVAQIEEGEVSLEESIEKYAEGIKYLKKLGVTTQPLSQDVTRDEDRCTHCGACITICPTGALYMDRKSMKVIFDAEKCIACELCVNGCPPRAMKVKF